MTASPSMLRAAARLGSDAPSGDEGGGRDVPLPRASILVVDDVHANLVSLEAILEPLGHRIVRATSGEEALKRLLEGEFAVVLLDVQMPGIDGFETASLMKSHPRLESVPIVFITAISRDAAHVFKGYAHGAVDYLQKPVDADVLRAKISVFVDLYLRGERVKAQAKLLRQKELELAERKSRERYFRLTDTMPIALWATRPDGTVFYANRVWNDYVGAAPGELLSFDDPAVVHEDDHRRLRDAWLAALGGGLPMDTECRLRRRSDGSHRWHVLRATPELRDGDEVEGWIVTATDIDHRRRAEEVKAELLAREQQARQQAEAANRLKDEFLATVSHELRTPLHAIVGWVKMLRSGLLDRERMERALETIERNAHAQAALVDDILEVSRIITGKLRVQVRPMSLAAVVSAAVEALRPAAEAKGLRLVVDLEPDGDEGFAGDPARLQQVAWNLVANAVKFTPRGGEVRASLRRVGAVAELVVADTGSGIPSEFLPFVFERFTQADSGISRAHGGLGLGLAIVRHLVELHGGTVEAASGGRDAGAVFTVRLPARTVDEAPEPALFESMSALRASEQGGAGDGSAGGARLEELTGLRVLVVDDDQDARDLLSSVLERCGASVTGASSAAEAFTLLERERPDVLVSDIGLPGEDGYSLVRRLRSLAPHGGGATPAIAVSGYARAEDRRRALDEGFQAHLAKPVELTQLVALVASLGGRAPTPSARSEGAVSR